MVYNVNLSNRAVRDLDTILEWLIEEDAGETGSRWLSRMKTEIQTLENMPLRCARAPESTKTNFEMRQLVYGKKPNVYRVLFTVKGDTVVVLNVRHGRRDQLDETELSGTDQT
jgi:plasmid stabilization system protein ParE